MVQNDKFEVKNAVIKGVSIFFEDHGILTSFIDLDYGGSGQGFGGWGLGANMKTLPSEATPHLGAWIVGILRTLEVNRWEDLKGKSCRVRASYSRVEAIGHLLKNKWFEPGKVFERMKK